MRLTPILLTLAATGATVAEHPADPLCPLVLHEERQDLEETRLALNLARSNIAAFEEIFALIDGLFENDAIDRMTWLRAKHDRDSARLALERAELALARQGALLDQYRLFCEARDANGITAERRRAIADAHARYRRADCDQQAKAIAIAENDLEFSRQWLAGILDLRDAEVTTRQDVILAERDVELEEKRLADARRRTGTCRGALGDAVREPVPPRSGPAAPR